MRISDWSSDVCSSDLDHVTGTIFWLDRGMVRRLDQGFAGFEAWSEEILERAARERDKLDQRIAQETAWTRAGISARRRRNRSEERRVGNEGVSTCRSRRSPYHSKQTFRTVHVATSISSDNNTSITPIND